MMRRAGGSGSRRPSGRRTGDDGTDLRLREDVGRVPGLLVGRRLALPALPRVGGVHDLRRGRGLREMSEHRHRHYWTDRAICAGCGVRRCRKWHCDAPRAVGALCGEHAARSAGQPEPAMPASQGPRPRAVHVLTYSRPAARREELR